MYEWLRARMLYLCISHIFDPGMYPCLIPPLVRSIHARRTLLYVLLHLKFKNSILIPFEKNGRGSLQMPGICCGVIATAVVVVELLVVVLVVALDSVGGGIIVVDVIFSRNRVIKISLANANILDEL